MLYVTSWEYVEPEAKIVHATYIENNRWHELENAEHFSKRGDYSEVSDVIVVPSGTVIVA